MNHRWGRWLGGLVHNEAHLSFPNSLTLFKYPLNTWSIILCGHGGRLHLAVKSAFSIHEHTLDWEIGVSLLLDRESGTISLLHCDNLTLSLDTLNVFKGISVLARPRRISDFFDFNAPCISLLTYLLTNIERGTAIDRLSTSYPRRQ